MVEGGIACPGSQTAPVPAQVLSTCSCKTQDATGKLPSHSELISGGPRV